MASKATITEVLRPTYATGNEHGYRITVSGTTDVVSNGVYGARDWERYGWVARGINDPRVMVTVSAEPWEWVAVPVPSDEEFTEQWVTDNAQAILTAAKQVW